MDAAARPEDGDRRDSRICVVDDDAGVCHSLSVVLEAYGYPVLTFSSAAAFLSDDRHRRAALLIIDQHMPEMGGLDVVAALKREEIVVPAMLITGRLDPSIIECANKLGVTAVLEKPFSVSRLVDLVRVAMGRDQGAAAMKRS